MFKIKKKNGRNLRKNVHDSVLHRNLSRERNKNALKIWVDMTT